MLEYVLLKGINDTVDDAIRLARLIRGIDCKINVIPYNETDGQYKRPADETINKFVETLYLHNKNFQILIRWSNGLDIDAGCGQLAVAQ